MATEPRKGKGVVPRHPNLRTDDDLGRWFRNLRSGSEKTAKVRLSAEGRLPSPFLDLLHLSPQAIGPVA